MCSLCPGAWVMPGAPGWRERVVLWLEGRPGQILFAASLSLILALSLWTPGELPQVPGTDKLHHVSAFIYLSMLAALSFPRHSVWLVSSCILGFGALIEIAQMMTNDRQAEWADLAADFIGIVIGTILIRWLRRKHILP